MKRSLLYATLALATLLGASCQKEEMGRVLTATIEQYNSDAKVYVNTQHYACWNNGDTVRINGQEVLVSIDGETATLPIPEGMEDQNITAFYPASDINSNMCDVTLPYEQVYRTDGQGRQIIHNPMAAYCPVGGTELKFRNLAALLKITLPAQEGYALVHSITVKGSKGYPLCGSATLEFNSDHKPQLSTPLEDGRDSVTLTHIDVALTTARSFYIVVPAYTLFREITVSVVLERPQGVVLRNRKNDDTFGHLLDRNQIGALTYNLDGTERIIGGKRVIFYTTIDGSTLIPQNMGSYDNSEYGVLVFENNVTSIGNHVFDSCINLTSIALPEGLTSIGESAFNGCFNLTSITLPEGVTTIGNGAFSRCGITSIRLPEGVTTIGNSAFNECSHLTSITLPASLTSIGNSAFNRCTDLTSITLPASLTSIGTFAFSLCGALRKLQLLRWVPDGNPSITRTGVGVFNSCHSPLMIYVPSGSKSTYISENDWSQYSENIWEF